MKERIAGLRRTASALACLAALGAGREERAGRAVGQGYRARSHMHGPVNAPPLLPVYNGQSVPVPQYRAAPAAKRTVLPRTAPAAPAAPPAAVPRAAGSRHTQAPRADWPRTAPDRSRFRPRPGAVAETAYPGPSHPPPASHAPVRSNSAFANPAPVQAAPGAIKARSEPRSATMFFRPPLIDGSGKKIRAEPIPDLPKNSEFSRRTFADPRFVQNLRSVAADSSERDGKFHWYHRDGMRYNHRYDKDSDRHWFGFYRGGDYAYTVYWNNHFWWQEPARRRWLSYWRDQWWWHSPQGVYYIYIGDQYYQWNPGANGVVLIASQPRPDAPAAAAEPAGATASPLQMGTVVVDSPEGSSSASDIQNVMGADSVNVSGLPQYHYSGDATRMVQVEGAELSAYLYDLTKQNPAGGPKLLRFLDQGVTGVEFSDPAGGSPLRILLSIRDARGHTHRASLDADGNPAPEPAPAQAGAPTVFGTPGKAGFDAPPDELPPTGSPLPDGI